MYVRAWSGDAGTQFLDAAQTLLTQYQTTGLIFDFRTNYGGIMFLSYPALSLLFDEDVPTIAFAERCGSWDHVLMCPSPKGPPFAYVIHGTAAADYDRPIAVLVGPGALSAGDQVAHLFSFHPRARFFGKSTATAFNAPTPRSTRTASPIRRTTSPTTSSMWTRRSGSPRMTSRAARTPWSRPRFAGFSTSLRCAMRPTRRSTDPPIAGSR